MAIWDDAIAIDVKPTRQLSAYSHKCPGCASNLLFDDESKKLQCKSCGKDYYPEFFEISDVLNQTISNEDADDSEENFNQEIVCNSCGAVVVAERNTASSFCAFCGSPALVANRLSRAFKPDTIIPFKIDREKAETIFREWASTKKYLPRDFLAEKTIRKISGLYVPFWLIDADCTIDVTGGANNSDEKANYYYNIRRKGTFKMRRVPFDGSLQISDQLMESIEPFDYREMLPYSSGYLPGYYAERYDLSADDMAERISDRFRYYLNEECRNFVMTANYEKYIIDTDNSVSDNYSCLYALLPVWFLSYEYKGLYYRIAINGQTGEIAGSVPEDEKAKRNRRIRKSLLGYLKLIALIFVISIALGLLMTAPFGEFFDFGYRMLMALVLFVCVSIPTTLAASISKDNSFLGRVIGKLSNKAEEEAENDEEKANAVPGASAYISSKDKVYLEIKEDKLVNVIPR